MTRENLVRTILKFRVVRVIEAGIGPIVDLGAGGEDRYGVMLDRWDFGEG